MKTGFSVIPIYGDRHPEQAKAAMVDWKGYQGRFATMPELYHWFFELQAGGLAIITGRVSRLVVFDFDDEHLALKFMCRFAHLCNTRIVHSAQRDLPHIYFRLPIGVTMPSRRLRGLDVQSDGRYIVAPPTVIDGKPYRVVRAGFPRELSREDVQLLIRFVDELASAEAKQTAAEVKQIIAEPTAKPEPPRPRLRTPEECSNHYLSIAPYAGRNNALFRTALMMRDTGWTHGDTLRVLQPLHASLARSGETAAQREREAMATIRSAFSRPPRPLPSAKPGLPNSLREALLEREFLALLRVLEGLVMHGVPAGALLTEKDVVETLKGCVGRHSILQALHFSYKNEPIFVSLPPFPKPHTPTDVASSRDTIKEKKCTSLGVTPSDKNRGRPAKRFQMPSLERLCQLFGVRWTRSDTLERTDLQSPASYRRGMHREFIKRRPGTYHVKWLAQRLNVVDRTIQRYNRVCGVKVEPMFERYLVHTGMMHVIEAANSAMFLEDVRGRRYPCKVDIAERLLRRGRHPRLCIQTYSLYTHPDGISLLPGLAQEPNPATKDPDSVFYIPPIDMTTLQPQTPQRAARAAPVTSQTPSTSPPAPAAPPPAAAPKPPRSFRRPLSDPTLEAAACRLYHHVRDLVARELGSGEGPLSMANARRLAFTYGVELLTRCQITLHQRSNIRNYGGFVVSFLRSEANVRRLRAMSAKCAAAR